MAQLIKLQDYISRYEADCFRYASQFIRMKKEGWLKLQERWEISKYEDDFKFEKDERETKNSSTLKKWFKKKNEDLDWFLEPESETNNNQYLPKELDDLKLYFLDSIYPIQLKWASSTINETSFIDKKYQFEPLLKLFLQRFPDTFLILYYPVFRLKQATVEGEVILITPIEILCITVVEVNEHVKIITGDDRTWFYEHDKIRTKKLSPMLALKRTENIVKSILKKYEIDIPVSKIVLSRKNTISFRTEPYNTRFIGKDQYKEWFQKLRRLSSPLKHVQLKAGDALLSHCQTTSVRRPEWELGDDEY